MKKKEYETPKMDTIDFEYKTTLLAGSVRENVIFAMNNDDVTDPKA